MGSPIKRIISAILVILAIFLSSQVIAIEIVTHLNVPDKQLTQSQLRRIYSMRQLHWSNNTHITVFVLPSQNALHHRFAKECLQIFPYQLNRIWHKLTYSGLGVAPTIVESEQDLIKAVISTPGAIGYISDKTSIDLLFGKAADVSGTKEGKPVVSKEKFNVIKITD